MIIYILRGGFFFAVATTLAVAAAGNVISTISCGLGAILLAAAISEE